jgi:3'-phosphoadenosine 5'-phosphosulfate sulfotransferase (PAPS reductase)/FAD synthetase
MKPGTKEYRVENLSVMQSWPLERKIYHSLKRINEFYRKMDGQVYVAYSGGLDSTVLLHLVRTIYPNAIAVFSNTTNEHPEILQHVRRTPNVIEVNPKMTFTETIPLHGFPLVSKKVSKAIGVLKNPTPRNVNLRNLYATGLNRHGSPAKSFKLANKWWFLVDETFDITNKCCDILKKEPLDRYAKETETRPFIGTLASESKQRYGDWVDHGCNITEGKKKVSRPLSIWTNADVWEYIRTYKVPYSSAYDPVLDKDGRVICEGETRTGCAFCGFGAHLEKGSNRFQRLAIRKPHQFKKMMGLTNNGVTFREALETVGVDLTIPERGLK